MPSCFLQLASRVSPTIVSAVQDSSNEPLPTVVVAAGAEVVVVVGAGGQQNINECQDGRYPSLWLTMSAARASAQEDTVAAKRKTVRGARAVVHVMMMMRKELQFEESD